jgi:hypothetical protein
MGGTSKKHAARRFGPRALFDAFKKHDFSANTCFLCGLHLTALTRSDEHVFPQWLLHRFELHNKRLTLLNGTQIPYRQLTIPCCKTCNSNHLSSVESKVRNVVEGRSPLDSLDEESIFIWTGKIFYGILYREVLLPIDRSGRERGSIVPAEEMQSFRTLHAFLQTARLNIGFQCMHASFPASVFAFKVQEPRTMKAKFDFRDSIRALTVYVRLGSVGFIAAFDTGAVAYDLAQVYRKYKRYRLHPVQFEELGAAVFYKATLFNRVPKLMVAGNRRTGYEITILPLQGMSTRPVFLLWNTGQFASVLSEFVAMPVEQLLPSGAAATMTFLRGEKSERFQAIDIKKSPYRGLP